MIKRLITLLALITFMMLPASNALAFSVLGPACTSGPNNAGVCSDTSGKTNNIYGPDGILDKVINLISIIIGIVAVFAIVVAGLMFATSGGDAARINTAKNTILYVVIGLIVVALAQIIEAFVINHIGHSL